MKSSQIAEELRRNAQSYRWCLMVCVNRLSTSYKECLKELDGEENEEGKEYEYPRTEDRDKSNLQQHYKEYATERHLCASAA